ncbi:MAG: MBL fold metallo-hydrolase [Deltaproteobacteria bacterium]|nr:MBL fold metallo-hydrolase [Deltaproteobacteria bacterium]MBW1930656.1 MBL fold metallo-hydrolase [Deltaproteobacteria bacterium]MBW2023931.1 MBL fold metallo-hydrolase [Deltaproteobacteria bacterium]MBW2124312.1 MBL fold metallo-hydrolase [Deltaproteobacteria bacterium]
MEQILIEIKQKRPEFDGFIGTWLVRNAYNIIVDVGPASTADRLISSLEDHGVKRLDYIFVTHIHIDHAGALSDILRHYPMAKAICHENALKHIIDPSRLWEGSLKVLGEIAQMYGPPKPVNEDRLVSHRDFRLDGLNIIETPGHAPHHLCYAYKGALFVGEAGGNYLMVNGREYLRPATPPRFFLDVFLDSIDSLLRVPDQRIYYAHFGWSTSSHRLLIRFRDQILFWSKLIEEEVALAGQDLVERCVNRLLREDRNLEAYTSMYPEVQERERTFMVNAVKGFVGYFQENN